MEGSATGRKNVPGTSPLLLRRIFNRASDRRSEERGHAVFDLYFRENEAYKSPMTRLFDIFRHKH